MNTTWKKSVIILIGALFISLSASPALMAEQKTIETPRTFTIECGFINNDGTITKETMDLTEEDVADLEITIRDLLELLRGDLQLEEIVNLLSGIFDGQRHPILYRLITYILSTEAIAENKLVVSQGWGIDLLPFQKTKTKFVKPLITWRYAENSDMFPIPSTTAVLNLNPYEVQTFSGGQLGFMLKFKGVYVHIPKNLPEQSYTFFLGSAKYVFGLELPTFEI